MSVKASFHDGNCSNLPEAFRSAMAESGIKTNAHIIGDGVLHRFHIEGHARGSLNGAYILHCDARPTGWFMDHKSGIIGKWSPKGQYRPSKDDLKAIHREQFLRSAEQAELLEAQAKAKVWHEYESATICTSHPYLSKKNVDPVPTLRLDERGTLLVPMWDEFGQLVSLQRIYGDDNKFHKRFEKGCSIKGAMFWFGCHGETLRICEGLATGLSICKETGDPVYVAFTANNLVTVAKILRDCFPTHRIIICGDNDEKTPGNPGKTAALEAAKAVGGEVSLPPVYGDWNDFLDGCAA